MQFRRLSCEAGISKSKNALRIPMCPGCGNGRVQEASLPDRRVVSGCSAFVQGGIFGFGREAAPDVALVFVLFQNRLYLGVKLRIYLL